MTKYRLFLSFLAVASCGLILLVLSGLRLAELRLAAEVPAKRLLTRSLGLTDLSLWTEARYTRHPSQADLFTPFQEFPAAPDHFPAGSIVDPLALQQTLREQQAGGPERRER